MESHSNSKHRWLRSLMLLFTTCFRLNGLKQEKCLADVFQVVNFFAIRSNLRTSLQLPCTCFMFFLEMKPVFCGFNLLFSFFISNVRSNRTHSNLNRAIKLGHRTKTIIRRQNYSNVTSKYQKESLTNFIGTTNFMQTNIPWETNPHRFSCQGRGRHQWQNKHKKLMRNRLFMTTNMAAMTLLASREYSIRLQNFPTFSSMPRLSIFHNEKSHTPISNKVALVMHDVWSLFHRPQSIMFAINKCIDRFCG